MNIGSQMEGITDPQTNILPKRSAGKGSLETRNTPVILVCIHNVSGAIITHELLYALFSRHGKILRILIFEKLQIWKAFVEYSNVESALEARRCLNNFVLFTDGTKITIYPSNLDTIKFQKNNSGGVDYTVLDNLNIYGLKDDSRTNQVPLNVNSVGPIIQPYPNSQSNGFDPYQQQASINTPQESSLSSQAQARKEQAEEIAKILENRDNDNEDQQKAGAGGQEEEKRDGDDAEKDLLFLSTAFAAKPTNSKAQVTHVHSVPAQLYRDNPNLQTQQQQHQPQLTSVLEGSLPPGLAITSQYNFANQNQSFGATQGLIRGSMSLNYIPNTDPSKQTGALANVPLATDPTKFGGVSAPLGQLPQFGSLNNMPLMTAPNQARPLTDPALQANPLLPLNQQRPGLNRSFFSQPELPLVGDRTNPALGIVPRGPGFFPEISTVPGMTPVGVGVGAVIPQPGMDGLEYTNLTNMNRSTLSQLHDNLSMLLGKGDDNKRSKVLYVKGLEHKDIKVQMLYNIFSNFGNIFKIIYIPSKSVALLEFENADYSTTCMDFLNNIVFMGKPLRIYYSKYSIINLRNKKGEEAAEEEVFIGNAKTFRFKKNKNISINPPSSTLHISNLVKEVCTEETIRSYFAPYGRIEATKFIFMDNNKNMCLIRMASIEESLNAMAYLHDTDLGGRKIQISFTRSRI